MGHGLDLAGGMRMRVLYEPRVASHTIYIKIMRRRSAKVDIEILAIQRSGLPALHVSPKHYDEQSIAKCTVRTCL